VGFGVVKLRRIAYFLLFSALALALAAARCPPSEPFGRYNPGPDGVQALVVDDHHRSRTSVKTGVFAGHCATYCGLYHSEMLFSVAVVSPNAFGSWLKAQSSSGRRRDRSRRPAGDL